MSACRTQIKLYLMDPVKENVCLIDCPGACLGDDKNTSEAIASIPVVFHRDNATLITSRDSIP